MLQTFRVSIKAQLLVLVCFFALNPAKAQWVQIPDAQFATILAQAFPGSVVGGMMDTTSPAVLNAKSLHCGFADISTLEGVQYLDSLEYLNCTGVGGLNINSIPALPPRLIELVCSGNPLKTLPPLPKTLAHLSCLHSSLDSLPDLPASLINLDCSDNLLISLPVLPDSLKTLFCDDNFLNQLPSIPLSVQQLWCSNNQLTSLPPLIGVYDLACRSNSLISLSSLPQTMGYLDLYDNPNLLCLPPFKFIAYSMSIGNTGIKCLPNKIGHISSIPWLDAFPVCNLFNTDGCEVGWNIRGSIYTDDNADCVQQSNEQKPYPLKVNLYQSGVLSQSGYFHGGNYSFDTDLSSYTVEIDTAASIFHLEVTCPLSNSRTVNVTALDSLKYGIDFGLKCKPGFDVGVWNILGNRFRPSWNEQINIKAGDLANNYGVYCAGGVSGSVSVSFTGPAKYISPASGALTPNSVVGNTLTYNIADFGAVNAAKDFNIIVQTYTTAQAGQQVCFTVNVTPTAGDNNPSNNVLTQCFTVRTAFDPNDKTVSPAGIIDATNDWLTYTIRFQNTGNDTAIHVYIEDTLDTNLDMASFDLLAFSHPNVTQVLPGGVVKFNFPNIYLPDSIVNEPLSHGYVQYRVKPKSGLPSATHITNTAFIYFDFNAPEVTNTVENLFCIPDTTNLLGYVCPGGEGYLFNDTLRFDTGNYSASLIGDDGCDSLVNLDLTMLNAFPLINVYDTVCAGKPYLFKDTVIYMPGVYFRTFQSVHGCDSVVNLYLALRPTKSVSANLSICFGESVLFHDTLRSVSGSYSALYTASNGCDSTYVLNLTIKPKAYSTSSVSICKGKSYRFKGQDLTEPGTYNDTLTTGNCDSTITIYLTVDSNDVFIHQVSGDTLLAGGQGSITWMDCTNNQIVANQTDSIFTSPIFGRYAAIFTKNDCMDTTECMTVGYTALPSSGVSALNVYPNPNTGQVTIELGEILPTVEVTITNVLGQEVSHSVHHNLSAIHLPIKGASGVYFLTVRSGDETNVVRIVKK
ncbi:MAG: T9SS type A sorting domain-containing protein [Bacteroidetes bacterium]|nr:T9SS type A sorting domain-containing protein [Bacteroidota bacterium]